MNPSLHSDGTTTPAETDRRHLRTALVLGGGGSTGNAWLIGVVAGLLDAGLDVTDADVVIGTSAGATAAAQITGASPADLFSAILTSGPPPRPASAGSSGRPARTESATDHMARTSRLIDAAENPAEMRRGLGAAALELDASGDDSMTARWRATVATRLPNQEWPQRSVLITAVDAENGDPVVFDRHSGVDLADAVAASCSSGLAYRIGERRYIDGGYRTNSDNADLASGCERVLVLSPFSGRARTPAEWGMHLSTQIDELRAQGSEVETIFPGSEAEHMFGTNAMDLSMRPAAARAGHDQGMQRAQALRGFWS